MKLLSLVVPCYNEEETIDIFFSKVLEYAPRIDAELEFCFVDDGSEDRTLEVLRALADKDPRVHYLSFSRNFGKEAALLAGLEMSRGDFIVTMDVDLQDPPSLLPEMWGYLTTGDEPYDCVATRRTSRAGEPALRSFFARRFYKLINRISDTEILDGARDYRMMSRAVVDAIINDREYNRFSKGIFSWVGFRTKWISYENVERSAGKTSWSFWQLFKYAMEGILAYSTAPLYFSSAIGIVICFLALIALIVIVVRAILFGDPVSGWPSMMSVMTFLGGIILFCLGIIGLYLSKIYLETKKRQIYIVRERR